MADYQLRITRENMATMLPRAVALITKGLAGGAVVLKFCRDKRSIPQNNKMWPMLQDLSEQVVWYGEKLTKEEWKDVLTAGLTKQRAVPGIDGGFVMLGVSTSKQNKEWLSDLIELIYAFGSERQVQWSESSITTYEDMRHAA